jgi:hypothetical protein
MYLGQYLKLRAPLAGLFTLDPISPNCGPAEVIFGGDACHEAPQEMNNALILSHTRFWMNFFQNQDSWLNSSAIQEAENWQVGYRGPHTDVDSDRGVWGKIQAAVEKLLRLR